MRLFPGSFHASVVAVTVLATLVAAVAMGCIHYTTQKQRIESDLTQILSLSASESAARVARWLRVQRGSATRVASSATLIEELRRLRQFTPQDDEYFLACYRLKKEIDLNILSHQSIQEITIHHPETGRILLASTEVDMEIPSAEDDDDGFAEAQTQLWVSPMFAAKIPLPDETGTSTTGVPTVLIAIPIRERNELYGVLRVRAHVLNIGDNLLPAANYSQRFTTSSVYVVNSEGTLLSPSHFEKELRAAGRITNRSMLELKLQPPDREEFTSAFQQSRALLESEASRSPVDLNGYEGVRGRKVVGGWARVEGTDWVCVAEIDHDQAFAPLAELARTNLYLSLLICVLVVGLTIWLASRIVAPLKYLSDVATRLASGDRSVRCRMDRDDEIGRLAAALDNMADAVDESMTDLEQKGAHLAQSNRQLESELTERQRAEQQLRNSNAFLDSVIDNIPTMLFMKDAENLRYLRFNKAGAELVGHSCEEFIGKTDFDVYSQKDAEAFVKMDREVLNGREMVDIEEEEILTKKGVRILHTKKIPIYDEQGEPQVLLGISEDITERKRALEAMKVAKESAESASRAKSDFLANMSHEIRTPMNAVIGMTELVLDTTLNGTQRDYLTIVCESAESLLSIINQILDFSKIEAGKLELESVDFDLREELGNTLKSLGLRAHAQDLELAWEIHSDVPHWLRGDPVRLRQMLVNLVGNAIKFTSQGEVMVEVQLEEDCDSQIKLHFAVRDTGLGIAEEKQQQIFLAFEQVDTSTTRQFGGTGLGLAITSRLAEAMGGSVWLESAPGQGSTFHFTANFDVGIQKQPADEIPDLSGVRTLVVDDNDTNRRILREILRSWGMSVETVAGGSQALAVLQQTVADQRALPLVISDVNMPEMDGFMLAERLRSMPSLRETKMVMLTSGGRQGDVRRCEELNIVAHLMKPVKHSELLDAIIRALDPRWRAEPVRDGATPQIEPLSLPPLKILLAEDGKANQIVAVGLLEKRGHGVTIAANGQEAIELWRDGSYDVILMDVQMPVLDGLAATQRIRELEKETGQRIPIVAMTARAMKGDRELCLAAGMDDYVSKPVRQAELNRALSGLVSPSAEAPATDADTATPVIDWEAALDMLGGDKDLLRDVVNATLEEMPVLKRQLIDSINEQDGTTTHRIAHTIKGGASATAALRVQKIAAAVEESAANHNMESVAQQMPCLSEAIDELLQHCRDFVANH